MQHQNSFNKIALGKKLIQVRIVSSYAVCTYPAGLTIELQGVEAACASGTIACPPPQAAMDQAGFTRVVVAACLIVQTLRPVCWLSEYTGAI